MSEFNKIVHRISGCDFSSLKYHTKQIFEISSDGTILVKHLIPGSRKSKCKEVYQVSVAEVHQLYDDLRRCIENSNTLYTFIDNSDAELTIEYDYGRIEKMPRGLGNKNVTVGDIIRIFITKYTDEAKV